MSGRFLSRQSFHRLHSVVGMKPNFAAHLSNRFATEPDGVSKTDYGKTAFDLVPGQ
jgi:hypothetical protein